MLAATHLYPEFEGFQSHRWRAKICLTHHWLRLADGSGRTRCYLCGQIAARHENPGASTPREVKRFLACLDENRKWQTERAEEYRRLVAQMKAGTLLPREGLLAHLRALAPYKGLRAYHYDSRLGVIRADFGANLVLISGRRIAGRETFSISGDTPPGAVDSMGIDSATANPAEATTQFDATAANRSLKAIDAGFGTITGIGVSPVKATLQATWTQADTMPETQVTRRIGLTIDLTNDAQTVYSMLGGTTPTNIMALDFSGLATFTFKPQIEVTISNQSAQ